MTRPRPSPEGASALQIDLLGLPGIRHWNRAMRTGVRGTEGTRSAARRILLSELAAAARARVPLDLALRTIATGGETLGYIVPPGESPLASLARGIALLPVLAASVIARQLARDDRSAVRAMAERLIPPLEKGMALSAAMGASGDWQPEECALVAAAEESGALPEALAALSRHLNAGEFRPLGTVFTPWMALTSAALFATVGVILFRSARHLRDVYAQMGAELPFTTSVLVWLMEVSQRYGIGIVAGALLLLLLVRQTLSGAGPAGRTLYALFASLLLVGLPMAMVAAAVGAPLMALDPADWFLGTGAVNVPALLAVLLATLALMPWALTASERLIVRLGNAVGFVLRAFPALRAAARLRSYALWMAGLELGLQGGLPMAEAATNAARIAPRPLRRQAEEVASLVGTGTSLGGACRARSFPSAEAAERMALLEAGGLRADRLAELTEEAHLDAERATVTACTALEIVITIAYGTCLVFAFTGAYAPFFYLPGLIR